MQSTTVKTRKRNENTLPLRAKHDTSTELLRLQNNIDVIKQLHKFIDDVIEEVCKETDLTEFQKEAVTQIEADEHKKLDQINPEHNLIDVSAYYPEYKSLAKEYYRYLILLLSYDLEIEYIERKNQQAKISYERMKEAQTEVLQNIIDGNIDLPFRHKFFNFGLIDDDKEDLKITTDYLFSLIKLDNAKLNELAEAQYEHLPRNVIAYFQKHNYPQRFVSDLSREILRDRTDITLKFDKIYNNIESVEVNEFEDYPPIALFVKMVLSYRKAYAS